MNSSLQSDSKEVALVVSEENKINGSPSEGHTYIYSILMGVAVLCPWNTLLTTFDFFKNIYPDKKPDFIFPMFNFVPFIFSIILLLLILHKLPSIFKVTILMCVMTVLCCALPLIAFSIEDNQVSYFICLMVIILVGFSNGICQASTCGMIGMLPSKFMAAVMMGQGFVGIFLNAMSAICKAIFGSDTKTAVNRSTACFYTIMFLIMIVVSIFSIFFLRSEYVIYHTTSSGKPQIGKDMNEDKPESVLTTLGRIWTQWVGVFLSYIATFTVFPGATFLKPYIGSGWWYLYVVTFFNILDTLGRFLPNAIQAFKNCKQITLLFSIIRFAFAGAFFLIALSDDSSTWNTKWFKILILFIFSITNGYSTTCHMMYGTNMVEGKNKDIAGQIMTLFLLSGIAVGSVFAGTWVHKVLPS